MTVPVVIMSNVLLFIQCSSYCSLWVSLVRLHIHHVFYMLLLKAASVDIFGDLKAAENDANIDIIVSIYSPIGQSIHSFFLNCLSI